jgi:hypothetical protein
MGKAWVGGSTYETNAKTGRVEMVWFTGKSLPSSTHNELTIPAPTSHGFDIDIISDSRGVHVSFGGLDQDFDQPGEALDWVRRAMSREYQLRVDFAGNQPYRWTLEYVVEGGDPIPVLTSRHFAWFRWLRPHSHFRYRNDE